MMEMNLSLSDLVKIRSTSLLFFLFLMKIPIFLL